MKEYTVTLNNFSDKTTFCNEMTASSGSGSVPSRACTCDLMRPQSRNTVFTLSDAEATELLNDSRVKACEENVQLNTDVFWDESQTGKWDKVPNEAGDKNWGIKRCIDGQQTAGWGSGGTEEITSTLNTTSSGKNVDVVIVDYHMNFGHPEFRENPDGTGNLRSNQFNWFQYSAALGYSGNTAATYSYATVRGSHGTHVAGTVAGNTQGWARNANVYNMEFGSTAGGGNGISGIDWPTVLFEYIRHFHNNKPINAATGRRNPTIVNNSWGMLATDGNVLLSNINEVKYRGVATSLSGMTDAQKRTALQSRRIPVPTSSFGSPYNSDRLPRIGMRNAAIDADIEDAMGDGVIFVGSAGNSYWPIDKSGGNDYDNILVINGVSYYCSRGSSPGNTETSNGNSISVGAISMYTNDRKVYFSNCEERVDVFAPGVYIQSSVANASSGYSNQHADSRDSSYYNAMRSGTSMASPQVAGLLACAAEQYPNMKQADAVQYVIESAKIDQVADTSEGMVDDPYTDLGDSNNRYAAYVYKRPQSGTVFPHDNHGNRVSSSNGVKYPRVNSPVTKPS